MARACVAPHLHRQLRDALGRLRLDLLEEPDGLGLELGERPHHRRQVLRLERALLELAEHAALDYELPAAVWSRADAVDVVAIMTGGPMCGLVFDELGDAVHDLVGLAAGTCRHESSIDPARPGSSGWLSVSFDPRDLADVGGSYGARLRDSSRNSDGHPWLEGPNSKASYAWAWLQVELLRIASELPGGLNRPNLLLAMWSADLRPPHHQPGVRYQLDGFDDPEPIEPTVIEHWDAERREWVPHP